MSLAGFLRTLVEILEDAGIPCMLTGSLAAAYYSMPRATQDVDLIIEVAGEQIDRLVDDLLAAGLYVSREAAAEAVQGGTQFNAIDPESGWKADMIVRRDRPFSRAEFARRRKMRVLGLDIALTSLEDLIIAKLEWSRLGDSELQRRDVARLLAAPGNAIDSSYIERWVGDLGLENVWREVLDRARGD